MGDSQVEVARRLGKSLETVRKQTKMARARLRARTNAHAVAIAVSLDLI
jgi:DNA-binding CsgD family transcriptional regulator